MIFTTAQTHIAHLIDPYAELKAAHKAGKMIQWKLKTSGSGNWYDFRSSEPSWADRLEWRIKPEPDADGWILHDGGPCPVNLNMLVEYKLSGQPSQIRGPYMAGNLAWSHLGCSSDITRYRIAKPADPLARIKSAETFNDLKSALVAWLEKEGK